MFSAVTTRTDRGRRRSVRLAMASLVLTGVASVAPAGTTPAGAWGNTGGGLGCNAVGVSSTSGGRAVATTYGSACGLNGVRWRFYWGYGTWMNGSPATIVENPNLYAGGGSHRRCPTCTSLDT